MTRTASKNVWLFPSMLDLKLHQTVIILASNELCHEIMGLFILCKLIFQTCMCNHPVGLDVWFLVRPIIYFHTLCVRTAKALTRLRGWAGSPLPSLVAYVISTIISWAGSFWHNMKTKLLYKCQKIRVRKTKTKALILILNEITNTVMWLNEDKSSTL